MAFPTETLPSQGIQPQGLTPDISLRPEYVPPKEIETSFSHPLQERVASEWMPLLHEKGEGCPSRRLIVFRDRLDRFTSLTDNLTDNQLDGQAEPDVIDKVVQEASYIKIAGMSVATRLGIDVGSFMDKKMLEKMQEKYPPDAVYRLVAAGMTPLDAMSYLKSAYNEGREPFVPDVEFTQAEWDSRANRVPALRDPYQDVSDTWQRRAFGKFLRPSERVPNLFGEALELLQEFDGMSEAYVNNLAMKTPRVTADEVESQDEVRNKLISIAGEVADVSIAVDGYTASLGRDQEVDGNVALDKMIQRYRKTGRLVREGMREEDAMKLLRTVDHRVRSGANLPFAASPAIAAIIAGLGRT